MNVIRLASVAALLGGLVWVVGAVLYWGGNLNPTLYLSGLSLMVLWLAGAGYTLVSTAPIWLRAVVTLATPALGTSVWLIIRDSLPSGDVAAMVGGVLLVVAGGIGLGRGGPDAPEVEEDAGRHLQERQVHGRRAAR